MSLPTTCIDTLQRQWPKDTVHELRSQNFHSSAAQLQNPRALFSPAWPSGCCLQDTQAPYRQRERVSNAGSWALGQVDGMLVVWISGFISFMSLDSFPPLGNGSIAMAKHMAWVEVSRSGVYSLPVSIETLGSKGQNTA